MEKNIKQRVIIILFVLNHEMYLQQVKKIILYSFDENRCYEKDIESKPWNQYY